MNVERHKDMTATEMLDAIFGEGSTAQSEANQEAEAKRIAHWTSQPVTEAGVLKAWMMTATGDHLSIEMSELGAAGWPRRNPPERITVALDKGFDRLKVYRLAMIDPTPDGDIGAWVYAPSNPEPECPAEIHIFND